MAVYAPSIGETMLTNRVLRSAALALAFFLSACGGGSLGGEDNNTGGGGDGGTTPTGVPGALTLATEQSAIIADGQSTALLTATLLDTAGVALKGATISFQTSAGSLASADVETDANGNASVRLTSSQIVGRATVTARESSSGLSATATVDFVSAAAASVSIVVAPVQISPSGDATVTVGAYDSSGNPLSGELLNLDVLTNNSGGVLAAVQLETDSNGRGLTTYTAGPSAGTDTIRVRTAGGISATSQVRVAATQATGNPGSLVVIAAPASILADGQSSSHITAILADTGGTPMSGVTLSFETSAGTLRSSSAVTDATGSASVRLTSSATIGRATLTAREPASGLSGTAVVDFSAGVVARVVLSATPSQVLPGAASTLTAIAYDANYNPVVGEPLLFSFSQNESGATLGQTSSTTDSNGRTQVTLTAGTALGTDIVRVETAGGFSGSATVSVQANAVTLSSIAVTALTDSIVANGDSTARVRATVTSVDGAPVSGVSVLFTATAGTPKSKTVTTDANGFADFVLTSSTVIGTSQVTASTGGLSASATVRFVSGPATSFALTAAPSGVVVGGSSTVFLQALDAHGNPAEGESILWSLSTTTGGQLSSPSGATDINGAATISYTAGSQQGVDQITATNADSVSGTVNITASSSSVIVGGISVTLGANSITAGTSPVAINATVVTTSGTPAAGVRVSFSVDDGTLSPSSAVTSASGVATVQWNPPTHATTATARVSTAGYSDEASLTIVPGSPDPTNSSITANPSTLLADGASTTTITVIMNDAYGNPVANGRTVVLTTTLGALVNGNSATIQSGRAEFTLRAPTSSGTALVRVQDVPDLSTQVNFDSASTGVPASIRFEVSSTHISVAGVGQTEQSQITVTVLDTSGQTIDESRYGNTTLNNLRATFITQPGGGESLSGKNAAGSVVSSAETGNDYIDVRTSSGTAVMTLQSGTLPGIVEIQFSVLKFDGTDLGNVADIAATASLPQISIASGAPTTIVFTSPITNSIEVLGNGNYRRVGKVDVTDKYGNAVPDGTAVNFSIIDSVLMHDNTGATQSGNAALTRSGPSLIRRRCSTEPPAGGEATLCTANDAMSASTDFTDTITRNGATRSIQSGDLVLIRDAQSNDKRRTVSSVTSGTQLRVQSNYQNTASSRTLWTGAALSGVRISGYDSNGNLTAGSGIVAGGQAPFVVDYPANVSTILTGCYGYSSTAPFYYDDRDLRDSVPQSRQVIALASAGNAATTIQEGTFCFAPIAGATLVPEIETITLATPPDSRSSETIQLELRDGGDTIPLPYLPVKCFVTYDASAGGFSISATVDGNTDGDQATDVHGYGNVTITRLDNGLSLGTTPSATVTCLASDASTTISVSAEQ